MLKETTVVPAERIERAIMIIRGRKVMLDADLAVLYRVPTKRLNEQVRRNARRFPADFMFRLTTAEVRALRSQIATSNAGRGGRRYRPCAFTEHGAIMLASVLNSEVAVQASVRVVRAFVRLRQWLTAHSELARKLDALEKKYDAQFKIVFDAIRRLMAPPAAGRRSIGFRQRAGGENAGRLRPSRA